MTSSVISANTSMGRLAQAIATASSGYQGISGTEFEIGNPTNVMNSAGSVGMPDQPPRAAPRASMTANQNLFGVIASDTPGEQGQAYAYAVNQLNTAWQTFWTAARPFIEQLDNGTYSM
jgi:hypothetical protein